MSLILDALNKADRDRSSEGQAPTLQAIHGPIEAHGASARFWRSFAGYLFALVVLAAIAWQLLSSSSQPQPYTDSGTYSPSSTGDSTPGSADAGRQTGLESRATVTGESIDQAPDPVPTNYGTARQPRPTVNQVPVQPGREVASLYARAPADELLETDRERGNSSAAAEPDTGVDFQGVAIRSIYDALPFINQLPEQLKDAIPSIRYNDHDYHGVESSNTVVLNGKTRRKGDQIVSGVQLIEILEDRIVLEFRQRQFQLDRLNSWINL